MTDDRLLQLIERLERIETTLLRLVQQRTTKEWYTPAEVAKILGKAEYTVREWCRQGRVNAIKKPYFRGAHQEWLINHAELLRVQNRGLLPL